MIKEARHRWWVVVYAGRDPLTGRKRQKTGTAATKAEARQSACTRPPRRRQRQRPAA